MFPHILHAFTIFFGAIMNCIAIFVILRETPKTLRVYSLLLLNTCAVEMSSIVAHFIVDARMFLSSSYATIIISNGPCRAISDMFCCVVTDFMNLNMIYSGSLVAFSFWYRTRVLHERKPPGMLRLQLICLIFFVPHALHIAGFVLTTTVRKELESAIDRFYGNGYSREFGLYGYSDVTKSVPAFIFGYTIVFPLCVYSYTAIARNRLLSLLREKTKRMSYNTRIIHESLARALTIHAVLPVFVMTPFSVLTMAQMLYGLHSVDIEGLEYDISLLPALINPVLTLYFVRPYRIYLSLLFSHRRQKVENISPRDSRVK